MRSLPLSHAFLSRGSDSGQGLSARPDGAHGTGVRAGGTDKVLRTGPAALLWLECGAAAVACCPQRAPAHRCSSGRAVAEYPGDGLHASAERRSRCFSSCTPSGLACTCDLIRGVGTPARDVTRQPPRFGQA